MRHSIKRWLDWLMTNLLHPARPRPTEQPVHTRYEKAGLTLSGQPVPWNADAVVIELLARLPQLARQRTDFVLRLPGYPPFLAEQLRKDDHEDYYRISFRLPVPTASIVGEVLWKHRLRTSVPITVLSADEFLASLRIEHATAAVRLETEAVAAQTFVASQCRGLTAAAILRSPAGLVPLADLGVTVLFRTDRGSEHAVRAPLTGSQLATREALITASPPRFPRQSGGYTVSWFVGNRELASRRLQAVTLGRFMQSIRVSDGRFLIADKTGTVRIVRQIPLPEEPSRIGPVFVLASQEPGAAGLLHLEITAVLPGAVRPPVLLEQTVLVTDGPTVFAPGLVDRTELGSASGFELRHKGRVLSTLSISPVPPATFNAEGAFKAPPDFSWSPAAEEELAERLSKLLGGGRS